MSAGVLAIVLLAPALVAAAAIALGLRTPLARRLVDHPNHRSLHEHPTPRIGGLGLLAGALPVAAAFVTGPLAVALACTLAIALLSAVDDWRSLPVQVRLPAHAVAALVVVLALAGPEGTRAAPGTWALFGLFLAIVWMTNLYNFMDGADGLAGLMALFGFGALAYAAARAGAMPLAATCAALASAALGFLAFNLPPARVFMGDAGSVPLGFLAAVLGIHGALGGAWPWWYPVLAFAPFIVDATITLVRRLFRGERIWIAHRSHAYQRLVLAGWSPRRLATVAGALMAASSASAAFAIGQGEMLQCGILAGWSVLYAALAVAAEIAANNNKNRRGAPQSNRAPGEEP